MTWTWDADDLRRWAMLQKAVATVLRQARERGQPYKGAVSDLGFALQRATKARIPTNAQSEVAIFRQWIAIASAYVANGPAWRAKILDDLVRSHALASALLEISGPPTPPATAAVARRLPYRDD